MSDVKQGVTGFKVISFNVKKAKENEKVKVILEADADAIGVGPKYDMGDLLKAFLSHQTGDIDIGLSVFMSPVETEENDPEE